MTGAPVPASLGFGIGIGRIAPRRGDIAATTLVLVFALAGSVAGAPVAPADAGDHWAFQPVRRPDVPPPARPGAHPVDRFLEARLTEAAIEPAPPADRAVVLRRLSFNLTGLPPTPEELDAFLADESPDPEAIEAVVERLLASPRYGERWGRHWLDVVRYADTAGETADFPAPHAWRFRNWVIDAFNRDLPFDTFVRLQVAGDLHARQAESPGDGPLVSDSGVSPADAIVATGFLAVARRFGFDILDDHYLTIEDTIDTLGKAVLGLSLACARCHDHPFDPIPATDYYGLYGIFESTRFPHPGCEKDKQPRDLVPLESPATPAGAIARDERKLAALVEEEGRRVAELAGAASTEGAIVELASGAIDRGGHAVFGDPASGDAVRATVARGQVVRLIIDPRANHGADSTRIDLRIASIDGDPRTWELRTDVLDRFLEGNPAPAPDDGTSPWHFLDPRDGMRLLDDPAADLDGAPGVHAWRRGELPSVFVNASGAPAKVWTTLPPRTVFCHPAPDGPVAIAWVSPIVGTVSIRGEVADAHPEGGDGVGWTLELIRADLAAPMADLAAATTARRTVESSVATAKVEAAAVPVAYAVAEGSPHDAEIHLRGDPKERGPVVPRKNLGILGGQRVATTGESGRRQLAEWLTDPANPLTARVLVNRVWHHHFGRGLVATPNDFGTRGSPPSHPELLDWLASEFVGHGWSIKHLHRLITGSEAYRRASIPVRPGRAEESGQLFGHFPARRLDAEEIRDSLLIASGELDLEPGGPHPFPPEAEWQFTQHTPFLAAYEHHKRSVYLMTQRIRRHPFLALFDGSDPNTSTGDRLESTVPTQALWFMNNPFVHERAAALAERLASEAESDEARLRRASRLLFSRDARDEEIADASDFLASYAASIPEESAEDARAAAWEAWCRVLLASNEFLHVD